MSPAVGPLRDYSGVLSLRSVGQLKLSLPQCPSLCRGRRAERRAPTYYRLPQTLKRNLRQTGFHDESNGCAITRGVIAEILSRSVRRSRRS